MPDTRKIQSNAQVFPARAETLKDGRILMERIEMRYGQKAPVTAREPKVIALAVTQKSISTSLYWQTALAFAAYAWLSLLF